MSTPSIFFIADLDVAEEFEINPRFLLKRSLKNQRHAY